MPRRSLQGPQNSFALIQARESQELSAILNQVGGTAGPPHPLLQRCSPASTAPCVHRCTPAMQHTPFTAVFPFAPAWPKYACRPTYDLLRPSKRLLAAQGHCGTPVSLFGVSPPVRPCAPAPGMCWANPFRQQQELKNGFASHANLQVQVSVHSRRLSAPARRTVADHIFNI